MRSPIHHILPRCIWSAELGLKRRAHLEAFGRLKLGQSDEPASGNLVDCTQGPHGGLRIVQKSTYQDAINFMAVCVQIWSRNLRGSPSGDELSVESGEWRVKSGEWRVESGESTWRTAISSGLKPSIHSDSKSGSYGTSIPGVCVCVCV